MRVDENKEKYFPVQKLASCNSGFIHSRRHRDIFPGREDDVGSSGDDKHKAVHNRNKISVRCRTPNAEMKGFVPNYAATIST